MATQSVREKAKEGRTTTRIRWPIENDVLAKAVTKIRKKAGWSQNALSVELGKDKAYLHKIETQKQSIDAVIFLKLLMICGVDPGEAVNQITAEIKKKA